MTDPIVRLDTSTLSVDPGGQTRCMVTVRNQSAIVEGFRLQILGVGPTDWGEISPSELEILPEQEATSTVTFSPPAEIATHSGTYPFGVRVESVVDPGTSAVAEGDLEVGQVFGLTASITPTVSNGRRSAKHAVILTNRANVGVRLRINARDPEAKLRILNDPDLVELAPGATGQVAVKIKAKSWSLGGPKVRIGFEVSAEPDEIDTRVGTSGIISNPRRISIDGAFNQLPVVSRFVLTTALVAALVVGGGAAYALTRPPEQLQMTDAISNTSTSMVITRSNETTSDSAAAPTPSLKESNSTAASAETNLFSSAAVETEPPAETIDSSTTDGQPALQEAPSASDAGDRSDPEGGAGETPPVIEAPGPIAPAEPPPADDPSFNAAPQQITPSPPSVARSDRPVKDLVITVVTPPKRPNPWEIHCICVARFGVEFSPSPGYSQAEVEQMLGSSLVWSVYEVGHPEAAQYKSGLSPEFTIKQYAGKNITVRAELPKYSPTIYDQDGFFIVYGN